MSLEKETSAVPITATADADSCCDDKEDCCANEEVGC